MLWLEGFVITGFRKSQLKNNGHKSKLDSSWLRAKFTNLYHTLNTQNKNRFFTNILSSFILKMYVLQ